MAGLPQARRSQVSPYGGHFLMTLDEYIKQAPHGESAANLKPEEVF